MKKIIFVLMNLVTTLAMAQTPAKADLRKQLFEGLKTCDQSVYTNEEYLAVGMPITGIRTGHVKVISLNQPSKVMDFSTSDRVVDIKIQKDSLYILTLTTLEVWSLSQNKNLFVHSSHPYVTVGSSWRQKASGFILKDNLAVISHGTLGFSILDLASGAFVKTLNMPTVSSAQDIDLVNANTAVVAVDNDDEAQFRGMYLMDLQRMEIIKRIPIDNAFPSAVRVLDNNRLMMIYFNAVWKFDLNAALNSSGEPLPSRRSWKFPNLFIVDMRGKVAFDDKNLYACFNNDDAQTGARKIQPLAIDLATIMLK